MKRTHKMLNHKVQSYVADNHRSQRMLSKILRQRKKNEIMNIAKLLQIANRSSELCKIEY